ncbi:hypothetical protein B296_00051436 [Ensete ventricosum]|uniref:Uncharacterized protein n=1 Tax=Ensete ventricosum TaxID=4639 RepID=A0A426YGW8_ENSVE|nr:hypothetical protein B296_00051436 [Ensete ventricosum]
MLALAVTCWPSKRLAKTDRRVEFEREKKSGSTKFGWLPCVARARREGSCVLAESDKRKRRKMKEEAAATQSLARAMSIGERTPLAKAAVQVPVGGGDCRREPERGRRWGEWEYFAARS